VIYKPKVIFHRTTAEPNPYLEKALQDYINDTTLYDDYTFIFHDISCDANHAKKTLTFRPIKTDTDNIKEETNILERLK
jgi:hypothetical protein